MSNNATAVLGPIVAALDDVCGITRWMPSPSRVNASMAVISYVLVQERNTSGSQILTPRE